MSTRRLGLIALSLGLYAAAVGSLAVRAHLWNDELYTWYFARLPTVPDVWNELSTGVEQLPPFFYVVTRASLAVFGENQVALRMPSVLGMALACICLFVIVARRTSAWYGLVAALLPMGTGAFRYAWEARPYALLVGFAAAAILCQQLRGDGVRPRLALGGLAVALAAATAVHYYGVLVVLPLAGGEAVRALGRRKLDWPALVALCAPLIPLAVSAPLVLDDRKYTHAFWARFDLSSAPDFYLFLLRAGVFSPSRIPDWLGYGFGAVVLLGSLVVLLRRPVALPVEVTVASGFVFLPLAGVGVAEFVTGGYVDRYVLPAVLGPAMLVPLALHRAARGSKAVGIGAALVVAVWFGVLFQYWHREVSVDLDRQHRLIAFLEREMRPGGPPIAVAHPQDYLELTHYAPRRLARRIIRVSDPERALEFLGTRSSEDGLVVLSGFAPLRIVPYREQRGPFLLLLTVRGNERDWNWIEPALLADGRVVQPLASDDADGFELYRVP